MKTKVVVGVIAFLVLAVFILWFGGTFQAVPSREPDDNNKEQGSREIPPSQNDEQSAELPNPPKNYAELKQINTNLRVELKTALINKFNEVLGKIKDHPDSLLAWLDLASVKYAFDDYDGAEEIWLYAIKLRSESSVAYANLAQLYWQRKPNYPEAERMFLKVIEISPDSVRTYRDLSDFYRSTYKIKADQADDILLKGLKDNPEHPDLLSALATYYLGEDKRELAIGYYERLVKAAPSNIAAKEDLEDLKAGRNVGDPQ